MEKRPRYVDRYFRKLKNSTDNSRLASSVEANAARTLEGSREEYKRDSQSEKGYELALKALGMYLLAAKSYEEQGQSRYAEADYRIAKKIFESIGGSRISRLKKSRLEKATATASIVGILGGLFFLSSNITGNAIADMTTKTTSFLGAGLLIVGLIAGFFWLKGRKK